MKEFDLKKHFLEFERQKEIFFQKKFTTGISIKTEFHSLILQLQSIRETLPQERQAELKNQFIPEAIRRFRIINNHRRNEGMKSGGLIIIQKIKQGNFTIDLGTGFLKKERYAKMAFLKEDFLREEAFISDADGTYKTDCDWPKEISLPSSVQHEYSFVGFQEIFSAKDFKESPHLAEVFNKRLKEMNPKEFLDEASNFWRDFLSFK